MKTSSPSVVNEERKKINSKEHMKGQDTGNVLLYLRISYTSCTLLTVEDTRLIEITF